jgi:hypothetical protein
MIAQLEYHSPASRKPLGRGACSLVSIEKPQSDVGPTLIDCLSGSLRTNIEHSLRAEHCKGMSTTAVRSFTAIGRILQGCEGGISAQHVLRPPIAPLAIVVAAAAGALSGRVFRLSGGIMPPPRSGWWRVVERRRSKRPAGWSGSAHAGEARTSATS